MNPAKVVRSKVTRLTDLRLLGYSTPQQLAGQDSGLLDCFISVTKCMNVEKPQPWWHYTKSRTARLGR